MTTPHHEKLVITLANDTSVDIELWPAEEQWAATRYLRHTDTLYIGTYASRDRALSAACSAVEQTYGSRIVRVEPKDRVDEIEVLKARAGELETIVRAIAERDPVQQNGDCNFCREWLGGVVEQWMIDMGEHPPQMLGRHYGDHARDCLWLRARKATGIDPA